MKISVYPAASRGVADHGWLKSRFSFSFADYHNPNRMHFGKLRVFNDDIIEGNSGFGMHPHNNMEIISVPVYGALAHSDNLGHTESIRENEIQVMSAGKGIYHSEYNASVADDANFLQIWIFPRMLNIEPRYEKRWFDPILQEDRFQMLVSPDGRAGSLSIAQQAFLFRGKFGKGTIADYPLNFNANGIFVFVINGSFRIGDYLVGKRDAAEITGVERLSFEVLERDTQILTIEVPV